MRALGAALVAALAAGCSGVSVLGDQRDAGDGSADALADAAHDAGEGGLLDAPGAEGGDVVADGACGAGLARCDGRCVDLQQSSAHCGACGAECATGQLCAAGVCVVGVCGSAGQPACEGPDGVPRCQRGFELREGICWCPVGQAYDRAMRACVACGLLNQPACMGPGEVPCRAGVDLGGACRCAMGTTECAGACVDTATDATNCGACGARCAAGGACVMGRCPAGCPTDRTLCAGVCTDTRTDPGHCGACGMRCPAGSGATATCAAGVCGTRCDPPLVMAPSGACVMPAPARHVAPLTGAYLTSRTVRLRWVLPEGASQVRVEVCPDLACTTPEYTALVTGTEHEVRLAQSRPYFWRLRAATASGVGAPLTSPWHFVVRAPASVTRPASTWGLGALGRGTDTLVRTARVTSRYWVDPSAPLVHALTGGSCPMDVGAGRTFGYGDALAWGAGLAGSGDTTLLVGSPNAGERGRVYARGFGPGSTCLGTEAEFVAAPAGVQRFGLAIAGHADFDGDGYGDAAIGALDATTSRLRVFVYGGASGNALLGSFDAPSGAVVRGAPLLRSAGDVDGDGRTDLLVAEPYANDEAGAVHLVMGSAAGLDATRAVALRGSGDARGLFGSDVGPAGDPDGDGFVDVLVGAPGENSGRGRFYVFRGGAGGIDGAAGTRREGVLGANAYCGASVAALGLHDTGDEVNDVAVGCPGAADPATASGPAVGGLLVYFGSAGAGVLVAPNATYLGDTRTRLLGSSVTGAGLGLVPSTAGGGSDGLIACGVLAVPQTNESAACVSLATSRASAVAETARPGSMMNALAYAGIADAFDAGDMNGDGLGETLFRSEPVNATAGNTGATALLFGSRGPLRREPAVTLWGFDANVNTRFATGDFNGDGLGDLAGGGSQNRVGVYYGTRGPVRGVPAGTIADPLAAGSGAGSQFGASMAGAGDLNGDRVSDLAVGAPGYLSSFGRVYVFLGGAAGLPAAPSQALDNPDVAVFTEFGARVAIVPDVDRDGRAELAVVSRAGLAVFHGTATGVATAPFFTRPASTGSAIAPVGDFDHNGVGDFALTDVSASAGGTIELFLSPSDGGTYTRVAITGATGGDRIRALGDLDADGFDDFAAFRSRAIVTAFGPGSIVMGRGAMHASATVVPLTTGAYAVPAGDVDGDGRPDLIELAPRDTPATLFSAALRPGIAGAPYFAAAPTHSFRLGAATFWGFGTVLAR